MLHWEKAENLYMEKYYNVCTCSPFHLLPHIHALNRLCFKLVPLMHQFLLSLCLSLSFCICLFLSWHIFLCFLLLFFFVWLTARPVKMRRLCPRLDTLLQSSLLRETEGLLYSFQLVPAEFYWTFLTKLDRSSDTDSVLASTFTHLSHSSASRLQPMTRIKHCCSAQMIKFFTFSLFF